MSHPASHNPQSQQYYQPPPYGGEQAYWPSPHAAAWPAPPYPGTAVAPPLHVQPNYHWVPPPPGPQAAPYGVPEPQLPWYPSVHPYTDWPPYAPGSSHSAESAYADLRPYLGPHGIEQGYMSYHPGDASEGPVPPAYAPPGDAQPTADLYAAPPRQPPSRQDFVPEPSESTAMQVDIAPAQPPATKPRDRVARAKEEQPPEPKRIAPIEPTSDVQSPPSSCRYDGPYARQPETSPRPSTAPGTLRHVPPPPWIYRPSGGLCHDVDAEDEPEDAELEARLVENEAALEKALAFVQEQRRVKTYRADVRSLEEWQNLVRKPTESASTARVDVQIRPVSPIS